MPRGFGPEGVDKGGDENTDRDWLGGETGCPSHCSVLAHSFH